jgi:hypothetical protein
LGIACLRSVSRPVESLAPARGLEVLATAKTGSSHAAPGRQRAKVRAALAFFHPLCFASEFLIRPGALILVTHFTVLILH